jgi:hypothetical protein
MFYFVCRVEIRVDDDGDDDDTGYVVAEWFTARLTCLTHRPVTNVCAGCGFDPSSRH